MNPDRLKGKARPARPAAPAPAVSPAPVAPAAPTTPGASGAELVGGLDPLTAELVGQAPALRTTSPTSTGSRTAPTTDQPTALALQGPNVSGSSRASFLLPLGVAAAGTVAAVLLLASGRKPRAARTALPAAQLGGLSPTASAPVTPNIPFPNESTAAPDGLTYGTLAGGGR